MVGRILADGNTTPRGHVSICAHPKDHKDILPRLLDLGIRFRVEPRDSSSADMIRFNNAGFTRWYREFFGVNSHDKTVPSWALGMKSEWRWALLHGYMSGDGHIDRSRKTIRLAGGSASKKLALGIGTLGQTLGYGVGFHTAEVRVNEIMGVPLKNKASDSHKFTLTESSGSFAIMQDEMNFYKIKNVEAVDKQTFYGIVTEDHSYWANGVVHHNTHPIWLEADEASDYPEQGWIELFETVKQGANKQSRWRAHGVTRGVGGTFDDKCKPDSGWRVHRLPAMYRPTWNDDEREAKIKQYGHQDNADYRRNILGLPGDQNSPIFVLYRLMANVDTDQSSDYNLNEYTQLTIDEANVREAGSILPFLDMPMSHLQNHKNFWIGADIGWTIAPTAIVIFGEEPAKEGTKLRLLARIMLRKIATEDQVDAIIHLVETYRPIAFAMDSTGAGFPLLQNVQEKAREHDELRQIVDRIKGYNFSEKVIADFDERIEIDEDDPDGWKEAIIKRTVLEWSTDVLRGLVDSKRLVLPWDRELIGEFQGQTWTYAKTNLDPYGRKKIYSAGSFHSLDAARMAALAYQQNAIEELIRMKGEDMWEPPPMIFI